MKKVYIGMSTIVLALGGCSDCHEFHHASDGMVAEVQYEGFEPAFTPDPNVPNQPE
ncbi:hypothetical protein HNR44_001772 [Geomicrobium halophilum]|uniref:Uncharacterized protein n=1 Tax=Geomicrobium halophilum TaxID=549000 RepID=A0A841PPQ1_9BACL|nr:hypothetical protein [Geomicrobium halophilum]MBB6449794.1 hypothetical protein [Geomicrobium halophilum]